MKLGLTIPSLRCNKCDTVFLLKNICCPECGETEFTKTETSGRGLIYTYTVMEFVPFGPHKERAPYIIAVIHTDEKMKLTSIVETKDIDSVKINDKVQFR